MEITLEEVIPMLRHYGGTRVKCGYYWNPAKWEVVTVPKEGGRLPGGAEERHFRVPIVLLLLLAPVMGGLYVVFLPFIGFYMILRLAGRKAAEALQRALVEVVTTLIPAWRPGEAYFAGKRPPREGEEEGGVPPAGQPERGGPLEGLEREIESKRKARG